MVFVFGGIFNIFELEALVEIDLRKLRDGIPRGRRG